MLIFMKPNKNGQRNLKYYNKSINNLRKRQRNVKIN